MTKYQGVGQKKVRRETFTRTTIRRPPPLTPPRSTKLILDPLELFCWAESYEDSVYWAAVSRMGHASLKGNPGDKAD